MIFTFLLMNLKNGIYSIKSVNMLKLYMYFYIMILMRMLYDHSK